MAPLDERGLYSAGEVGQRAGSENLLCFPDDSAGSGCSRWLSQSISRSLFRRNSEVPACWRKRTLRPHRACRQGNGIVGEMIAGRRQPPVSRFGVKTAMIAIDGLRKLSPSYRPDFTGETRSFRRKRLAGLPRRDLTPSPSGCDPFRRRLNRGGGTGGTASQGTGPRDPAQSLGYTLGLRGGWESAAN